MILVSFYSILLNTAPGIVTDAETPKCSSTVPSRNGHRYYVGLKGYVVVDKNTFLSRVRKGKPPQKRTTMFPRDVKSRSLITNGLPVRVIDQIKEDNLLYLIVSNGKGKRYVIPTAFFTARPFWRCGLGNLREQEIVSIKTDKVSMIAPQDINKSTVELKEYTVDRLICFSSLKKDYSRCVVYLENGKYQEGYVLENKEFLGAGYEIYSPRDLKPHW